MAYRCHYILNRAPIINAMFIAFLSSSPGDFHNKALSFDERRAFYFQLRLAEKLYKSIVNRQISLTGTDRAVGGC